MINETGPGPTDLGQLAKDAENARAANAELAAGLHRVRGLAIERAKTANARLLMEAYLATLLGIAAGVLLGHLKSRRRKR